MMTTKPNASAGAGEFKLFQRPPRLQPSWPDGTIEFPDPPALPTAPQRALLPIVMPLIFAGMSVGLTVAAGTGNLAMNGLTGLYMGSTALVSGWAYVSQRKAYGLACLERNRAYRALIALREEQLAAAYAQQHLVCSQLHPDPVECVKRIESLSQRLWERDPGDADYLTLRAGLGQRPLRISVKLPKHEPALKFDPLIQEAEQAARRYASIPGLPVEVPLGELGWVGLSGHEQAVLGLARALVVHLAAHHSPGDVKVALLADPIHEPEWRWLTGLHHARWEGQALAAFEAAAQARLLDSLGENLTRRALQGGRGQPNIILIADWSRAPGAVTAHPAMAQILRDGPGLGVSFIPYTAQPRELPHACQAFVELSPTDARLMQTGAPKPILIQQPDFASPDLCGRLAAAVSQIQLSQAGAPPELPAQVPLLSLWDAADAGGLNIPARWARNLPFATQCLSTPIGRLAGGALCWLNLHDREDRHGKSGHGPHGLMAGTTGSGKSELLQTLIASLAVEYSPAWVSFLLIDYKGGGMADVFRCLPHVVGTVTNLLNAGIAKRALIALDSEVKRRQACFAAAGVTYIDDYQRKFAEGGAAQPLPRLVIVVDEFAELARELPDVLRQLISTARIGRSLGVHLLLATQKPAGVVNDQIWSNARFRICLRVEAPADSNDMLKRPDAASLNRPGRGYLQVGHNELFELFQSGFGGAPCPNGQKQLSEVTRAILACAAGEQLPALPKIWLEPLPDAESDRPLTLDRVLGPDAEAIWRGEWWERNDRWMQPCIGLADDPAQRQQPALRLDLGGEGHALIVGQPGSGKTTLLQTLITALALEHSPDDVWIYVLDLGSRLLTQCAALPQVGAVLTADDEERVARLLRMLTRSIGQRKAAFQRAGVTTLDGYREACRGAGPARLPAMPAIVLVIDNYPQFSALFGDSEEVIMQLAREGGALGLHLVISASGPSLVKPRISSNIAGAIALQLADKSDYAAVVGRAAGLEPNPTPGRGLVKRSPPLEFQAALAMPGGSEAQRTQALRACYERLGALWGEKAKPIAITGLPEKIALRDLLQSSGAASAADQAGVPASAIGLAVESLEPLSVALTDGPHFIITGGLQSGKTTLLITWLLGLAAAAGPDALRLYLADLGDGESQLMRLRGLAHARAAARTEADFEDMIGNLAEICRERRKGAKHTGADVIAIDEGDLLLRGGGEETKRALETLARSGRAANMHILLAASDSGLSSSYDSWVKHLKESQTGFVLGTAQSSALTVRAAAGEGGRGLPVGQGFYVRRAQPRPTRFKVATPDADATSVEAWVLEINQRHAASAIPAAPAVELAEEVIAA